MRFPFLRNRDSVKKGILISIRRTGDGFHPGLFKITVEDDCIILKKAENADIFTGGTEDLIEYEGKKVSKASILALAKLAGLKITE